jgi:hypothetical protein
MHIKFDIEEMGENCGVASQDSGQKRKAGIRLIAYPRSLPTLSYFIAPKTCLHPTMVHFVTAPLRMVLTQVQDAMYPRYCAGSSIAFSYLDAHAVISHECDTQ